MSYQKGYWLQRTSDQKLFKVIDVNPVAIVGHLNIRDAKWYELRADDGTRDRTDDLDGYDGAPRKFLLYVGELGEKG